MSLGRPLVARIYFTLYKYIFTVIKRRMSTQKFSLEELSALAGLPIRTVRFYIQKGLLDRPVGQRKAAYYTSEHARQLLEIEKWKRAGVALDAIRDIMSGDPRGAAIPPRPKQSGDIRVWSHIWLAPGLELHLDPKELGLESDQIRRLAADVLALVDSLKTTKE